MAGRIAFVHARPVSGLNAKDTAKDLRTGLSSLLVVVVRAAC